MYDDADEGYYAGVNFETHQVRTFGGRDVRWGGEQHFGDCEVDFGFSIKHWITFEGHSIRNFAINIHQKIICIKSSQIIQSFIPSIGDYISQMSYYYECNLHIMKFHYDAIYVFWHFDLFNTKFKHCTHSYFGNFFLEFWPEFVRKVLCHDSWIYLYSQRVNYKTSILYQACRLTNYLHFITFFYSVRCSIV